MNLGSYYLLEEIGKGGMGNVYKGLDQRSGKIVAIKVMKKEKRTNPSLLRRFEQEFFTANRLQHAHIVQGLDFGVEKNRPFLVMEYVDGKNLGQILRSGKQFTPEEAIQLLLPIADALNFAHQNNYIHRDVKPENIMVDQDGKAKLTDFGLIKDLDAEVNITSTKTCLGTFHFMAPEQYQDAKSADVRCDVYGLAATLYYAITGEIPFSGKGQLTVLRKKMNNSLEPPIHYAPSLDPQISSLICRALNPDPTLRPQTCKEFSDQLRGEKSFSRKKRFKNSESKKENGKTHKKLAKGERRLAKRYLSTRVGICRGVLDRKNSWRAEIQDISLTGMRIALNRRFEPDTVLHMEVHEDTRDILCSLFLKVCWVKEIASGKFDMGCHFQSELEETELEQLLDSHDTTVMMHE